MNNLVIHSFSIPTPGMSEGGATMRDIFEALEAPKGVIKCGGTGYLDEKVKLGDVPGVSKGEDEVGRSFITLKFNAQLVEDEGTAHDRGNNIVTLFQRYVYNDNNRSPWTLAVNLGYPCDLVHGAVDPEEAARIAELLRNGSVSYTIDSYSGKKKYTLTLL